ncbi:TetR/AcrR family transcriptional regulator [Solicola gregarius]|uniref:TetR/AcrR family transcriptional regulator n=1 Tax=Solicola gregarius TaxID=2908642 RepID=A0AA46THT7_9ACTN|nr:TetR/AcrR family transcriptional regulator [Solicola gregarius]UYM05119.1 TetR/AcrR family transcriptional regulator [Solicola gregarius]
MVDDTRAAQFDRGLTTDQILDLAVALADAHGLTAVSMRRLGRELAVTPMALYWHFKHKDALLDAMAERTVAAAEFVDAPDNPWDHRLRDVLTTLTDVLRTHPWMGRLVVERLVPQPSYLNALEIMLDCARDAGLSPDDGAVLTQQAVQAVVALVDYEPGPPLQKTHRTDPGAAAAALLDAIPPGALPNIRKAATELHTLPNPERYYQLGIDMIVGGIVAVACAPR